MVVPAVLAVAPDALGVVHRDPALALVHVDDGQDDPQPDDGQQGQPDPVAAGDELLGDERGEAGHDPGEDDQGDAVADALLGDQLAQPDQEHRPRGEGQAEGDGGQEGGAVEEAEVGDDPLPGQQGGLGVGLQQGQGHGEDAGVLGEARAPGLALLGELRQAGDHGGQDLHHDLGRDVGVDAEGGDGEGLQRAPGEEGEEAQELVALHQLAQGFLVDAGDGDVRHQPVDGQHGEGEDDLLAQVGELERAPRRINHWPFS